MSALAGKPDAVSVADFLRARRSDGLLLIELNSPDGFPRLTRLAIKELHRQFDADKMEPEGQAVIITGTEKCFAAGAELTEIAALSALEAVQFSALGQSLMNKIERHRGVVVAAIRGYCLGGGLDLALACHVRVASDDAVFGHPGAGLGIITGWGGTQRLPHLIGRARAAEMLATGRTITAREAYAWGFVNLLVPPEIVVEVAPEMAQAARIKQGA